MKGFVWRCLISFLDFSLCLFNIFGDHSGDDNIWFGHKGGEKKVGQTISALSAIFQFIPYMPLSFSFSLHTSHECQHVSLLLSRTQQIFHKNGRAKNEVRDGEREWRTTSDVHKLVCLFASKGQFKLQVHCPKPQVSLFARASRMSSIIEGRERNHKMPTEPKRSENNFILGLLARFIY